LQMKTLPVIAILCLTVMMVFPSTLPRVHAILSNGNNYWANYGPNVDNLLYKVYTDFTGMFTDFTSGQLDSTDWPVQPGDLSSFITNPDFFVLTKQPEFGIFELDINHMDPLINFASATDSWQVARTPGTPALVSVSTVLCGATCPANTFQLIIQLQNLEESNAAIKDANNLVLATITASTTSTTKADDGNPSPTGTYTVGVLSSIPASYVVSTSIYSGSVTLFTTSAGSPNCLAGNSCTYALRVNYNSGSTVKPSGPGISMARALYHLLNKAQYLTGPYLTPSGAQPLAGCDDVQAPPSQNLMPSNSAEACEGVANSGGGQGSQVPASVQNAECSDVNIAALGACAPSSLYTLKSNTVGGASSCAAGTVGISCFPTQSNSPPPAGYASNVDLAAACIYLLEAGFTTTGTAGGSITAQCQSVAAGTGHVVNPNGSCNTGTAAGCIVMYIRTHLPRRAFGTIVADELNYLFGTVGGGTICYGGPPSLACSLTPVYFTIAQVGGIVFDVTTRADWNLYTGGFGLGTTPDHLHDIYHSSFASNACDPTATANSQPNNYNFWCDPSFDTQANAGEFVPGVTYPAFQQAAIIAATRGATDPVYSGANYFVALNSWSQQGVSPGTGSSIVGLKGHGLEAGYPNLMNTRPTPGYVPSNSLFYASGCNPSTGCAQNTLRRGLSQTTLHMTVWTYNTVWEAEFLNQIYDTMLSIDPNGGGLCQTQPGGTSHCIDWMTTSHGATANTPVLGQTTWTWNLRSDIFWHDGVPVTAHDVCFSIFSLRDAPSSNLLAAVSNVVSCTAVGNKVAQIVVTGNSPFTELNLGGVYMVPEHIWAPICGGLQTGTDRCVSPTNLASPSVDHVAAGDMVGSAAWICNLSQGVSTIAGQASCTQNANGSPGGQALAAGGRVLLQRNTGYMRCCSNLIVPENGLKTTSLQALEWSDFDKNGKVDISDIANAASVFGQSASASSIARYFAHPLYAANPSTASVDIGNIATVASYFDHGITSPFLGTNTGFLTSTPPAGLTQYSPVVDPYGSGSVYVQGFGDSFHTITFAPGPGDTPTGWRCGYDNAGTALMYEPKTPSILGDNHGGSALHDVSAILPLTTTACTIGGVLYTGGHLDIWVYYPGSTSDCRIGCTFEEFQNGP